MFFLLFMLLVEIFSDAFECRLEPIFKSFSPLKCKFLLSTTISDMDFFFRVRQGSLIVCQSSCLQGLCGGLRCIQTYCLLLQWFLTFLISLRASESVALTRLLIQTNKSQCMLDLFCPVI